jgi:hypothetical protein
VEAKAVELDGQAMLRPATVDVVRAPPAVRAGQREAVLPQQRQERALHRAQDETVVALVDRAELRRTGPAAGRHVPDAELHVGLMARSGEGIEGEDGGEVGDRLRDGGGRDAVPDLRRHLPAPGGDAGHRVIPRRTHLRCWDRAPDKAVVMRRRRAAQHGACPARQHRRHVARLDVGRAVAEPVDAAELPVQQPALDPPVDARPRHPGREQLPCGDHPVLAPGLPRDRSDYCPHTGQ